MRLEGGDEADEGNDGGGTGGVSLGGGALEGSGAVDGTSAGGSGCGGAVAVGSLDLTVGDLNNGGCAGLGGGSAGLDLTVGDLGYRSASGSSSAGLDLAVGNLGDGSASGSSSASLDLAVGDLAHGSTRGGGLDLTIGDLGDRSLNGSLLGLAVGKLRSSAGGGGRAGADDVDVDIVALLAGGLVVVEVVEVAAQALVEDGRATEGKRAVAASGPASGVDCAGLGRAVELELVVGSDVTGAVLGVGEDTVGEVDEELGGVILLSLLLFLLVIDAERVIVWIYEPCEWSAWCWC